MQRYKYRTELFETFMEQNVDELLIYTLVKYNYYECHIPQPDGKKTIKKRNHHHKTKKKNN